jgi:hypothetical protein
MRIVSIAILALTLAPFAMAQSTVVQPKVGNPLREAVLNGLRPTVEKDLNQKVVFKVFTLRVYKGWAFFSGSALQPNGNDANLKISHYRNLIGDPGFGGDEMFALLKLSGKKWKVKAYVFGPSDLPWAGWWDSPYYAPRNVFPPLGGN